MLPVLGFAYGPNMDNLVYVGMVGIMDPPRHGVREAIALLQQGGVSVKMLTGDAQETADSIGESGVGVWMCFLLNKYIFNNNYYYYYLSFSGEELDRIDFSYLSSLIIMLKLVLCYSL